MRLLNFAHTQLKLSRRIGRKDYDGAIDVLENALTNTDEDVPYLVMIAWCHRWSNRGNEALAFAERARACDVNNFEANRLLADICAERNQHELAIGFARVGLDHLPASTSPVPGFVFSVLRSLTFFMPRLRRVIETAKAEISLPNKDMEDWRSWAKQYLVWYETEFVKERLQESPIIEGNV